MSKSMRDDDHLEERLRLAEERLQLAEAASGIGIFDLDLGSLRWDWTAQLAKLFGIPPQSASPSFPDWEGTIFSDDVPKLHAALETVRQGGAFQIELRVRHP